MKKLFLSLFVFVLSTSMAMAAAPKMSWKGYVKTVLESGGGSNGTSTVPATNLFSSPYGSGPKIGVANSRITADVTMNRAFGSLQVEIADGVADGFRLMHGYAGYTFAKTTKFQVGRFKVPIGIDHLLPNSQLDLVEENALTAHLTHGWKNGLMISGDLMGSLSYNIAYFTAENRDYRGIDDGAAARLMYDRGNFHLEAALAVKAGNDTLIGLVGGTTPAPVNIRRTSRDFTTTALGASYESKKWMLKGEFIQGSNVTMFDPVGFPVGPPTTYNVIDTFDMNTIYVHYGYNLGKKTELVVRHYMSSATNTATNYEAELTNTYIGINLRPEKDLMFKFNYVMVGGDDSSTAVSGNTGPFPAIMNSSNNGLAGGQRAANTFLAMAQIMF